jgi:2'-hydroxyisoflavone reductase
MATRRQWLQGTVGLAGLALLGQRPEAMAPKAARKLKLLILGGTGFLGPHQVEHALARGHEVTLFNRGRTAADLYGNRVETLLGNRDAQIGQGLRALEGSRRWDVVIDNSGYLPRHVRDSAALLKGRVGRYLYVSTISVYPLDNGGTFNEASPLPALTDPTLERITGDSYGPLKAECDRSVRELYGSAATVVRPTYVVGPGDDTDRFTYWVERLARGGDVLMPPEPGAPLQWIDVRDLCPWMVELAEQDTPGIFNAAARPASWEDVLTTLATVARTSPRFRKSTPELLERLSISLPLVAAGAPPFIVDTTAAERAGLRPRPLSETAEATLSWWRSLPPERRANPEGWLDPEREREALARLRRV